MFLSVIIPVYNVEPYLHRCIDSVIAQDMGDDIELLLVMTVAKMHRGQYVMNMHRSIVGFMPFIFPTEE